MLRSIITAFAILLYGSIAAGQTLTLDSPGPADNSNFGVMFDVDATNAVTITGFDIALWDTFSNDPVYIYTRTGTHVGVENNSSAWTLAGTANISGQLRSVVNIPAQLNIALQAGSKQAFYIYQSTDKRFGYQNSPPAATDVVSDANLNILVGTGLNSNFLGGLHRARAFVGRIHYSLIAPPQPTSATPVPTLGAFGLIGLAGAIGAAGVAMTRRRKQ